MIEIPLLITSLIGGLFTAVIWHTKRTMPYVYGNAAVSAWEGRLLREQNLMELADAPNLASVLSLLENTEYRPYLAGIPREDGVDVVQIERALRENANSHYVELLQMVPEERKEVIEKLIGRVDLLNLKILITSIEERLPFEKVVERLQPSPTTPRERLELLARAESLEVLLEYLKGSEYYQVLSEVMSEYEKAGLQRILFALDKHYYSTLWREVLSKKPQREVLREMVGYEIDTVNIKTIARMKMAGRPPEEIEELIVRPSHMLTEAMLRSMITSEDLRSALEVISHVPYGRALLEVLPKVESTGSLFELERTLEENHLKLCKWLSLAKFFSLAPIVSYFYCKEMEVRNLRTIVRLKADGVEPGEIKGMLVGVPKLGA